MDNPITKQLMDVEKALREITQSLIKLKAEVGGYAAARTSLEQTQAHLSNLANQLETLSREQVEVARALRSIGTSEILAAVTKTGEQLESAIRANRQVIETAVRNVTSSLGQLNETSRQELSKATAEISACVNHHHRANAEQLQEVYKGVEGQITASRDSMMAAVSRSRMELNASISKLRDRIKWFSFGLALLQLLGLALLGYLIFSAARL
ncbi:MAG: hypothetical protein KatS3mg110_3219 [Pirellulaceae bacterium]|nr:MAG: hypothetical protein KatS3mg110_3219 [Pirellulaceae bacterium]